MKERKSTSKLGSGQTAVPDVRSAERRRKPQRKSTRNDSRRRRAPRRRRCRGGRGLRRSWRRRRGDSSRFSGSPLSSFLVRGEDLVRSCPLWSALNGGQAKDERGKGPLRGQKKTK